MEEAEEERSEDEPDVETMPSTEKMQRERRAESAI
jgi:hypothetical protein